ncbi:MAG: response regulator [Spirochaetales bacterium]|nr:response regulator [Spirochaetales bacterium]
MDKIKILVAEDEKLIREGIIRSMDWEALGAEISGQAKNGTIALKLLKESLPDILITDIKMGGGNGLDLIKEAKTIHPDLNVVIVSGYNNFEYAQQAIKLGVQDYLLKPIVIDDLKEILERVTDRVRRMKADMDNLEAQDRQRDRNRQILNDQFYRELIYGVIAAEDIPSKMEDYDLGSRKQHYLCLSLFLEIRDTLKWGETKETLSGILAPFCEQNSWNIESILLSPNELYHTDISVLISSDHSILTGDDFYRQIGDLISGAPGIILLAMGVSPVISRLEDFSFAAKTGKTQAYFSLISGMNSKQENVSHYELPVNIYDTSRELFRLFSKGSRQEMEGFLNRIEDSLNNETLDEQKKTGMLRNLLVCLLSAGDELGIAVKEIFPDLMVLFRYINLKTMGEMMEKIRWACTTILEQQQTREEKTGIHLMEQAGNKILNKYSDPLLSLDSLAAEFSLTPAYFSKLFKQFHGVSYIEFLTNLRIEKAQKLLRDDPSLKISAAAFSVGYNSSSYFNYIFKKSVGKTPREYQKKGADHL